jgi:hypothetical protein
MKKTLLSLFFLSSTLALSAQHEFAPIGAVWHHNEGPFLILLPEYILQHYRAESVADTVVLGRNCRKIVKNMAVICTSFDTVMLVHQHGDTVFLYDTRLNDFQVLYNFGAQPGDTWTMELLEQVSYNILMLTVRVDSVSVVNINGLDLRQQFVSFQVTSPEYTGDFYPSGIPITEKIGFHHYWLYQYAYELGPICDVAQPIGLRCYYDPEFGLYETGIAPYCDWVGTSTREPLAEPEGVRIFPNPAAGAFTIENLRAKPLAFDVMDMQGRTVLRGHTAGYRTETGIGALSPGVYSVVFREDGQPVGRIRLVIVR